MNTSSLTNKEKQIINSHREILWLKRQIEQFENEKRIEEEEHKYVLPDSATEAHIAEGLRDIKERLDELRATFAMVCQFNRGKDALSKTVNSQYFTMEALYPGASDHRNMEIKKATEDQINKRDELVVEFMGKLGELNKTNMELTGVQRKIMRQHAKNRELMTQIDQIRGNSDKRPTEPNSVELMKAISDRKDQIAVIRAVLNGMILESGIPWDEDDRWLQTVLRIGESLPSI